MIVKSALVPNAFSFPVLPVKSELTLAYSAVKKKGRIACDAELAASRFLGDGAPLMRARRFRQDLQ